MPALVLGPLLRHVGETDATVWVETDAPCTVRVHGAEGRTFTVDGHHYALVTVEGLEPGTHVEYAVELDGERVWPSPGEELPPSTIRTLDPARAAIRIAFGSCRVSLPHEPPWVLDPGEHPDGQGIDALRAYALRMARSSPDDWPDLLLMLGDQVYADDLSPALRELTERRRRPDGAPRDELASYDEYAAAYREAWSEPVVRWLLSTVPTAMVFDDHEIHGQWKISKAWLEEMRARPWYDDRISAGLAAYWVYQHLGNLPPAELGELELLRRVRAERDAGPMLRAEMRDADRQAGHSRWSFSRPLGRSRLVVVDSRAGREVEDGRRMVGDGEWRWIADQATGETDHLVLASSVPFFLLDGLHYAEAAVEAVAEGSFGRAPARAAERIRRVTVMDHWASFSASFDALTDLLAEVGSGGRGGPPASIVMLSGDVHHCYLAEVGFPPAAGVRAPVWQAVCSAYRKALAPKEIRVMRFGNSRTAGALARLLARAVGARRPSVGWRMVHDPCYDNQVGTLDLDGPVARLRVETTAGADWRDPRLRTVFEQRLAG